MHFLQAKNGKNDTHLEVQQNQVCQLNQHTSFAYYKGGWISQFSSDLFRNATSGDF